MKKIYWLLLGLIFCLIMVYALYYYFVMRNVKTPEYTVLKQAGPIEIRQYKPMLIAEVTVSGDRRTAIQNGFRLLADYIFGNNHLQKTPNQKIAMTAPVMQQTVSSEKISMTAPVMQSQNADQNWKVQFVMPAQYTLANIPKPNSPAVKLIEVPQHTDIVIRFSGMISDHNIKSHLAKLEHYIQTHQIQTITQPVYMFYNPPWTLPFMRRNEVAFRIKP